ncbi:MAG: succinylglutamate desuccinylase/aspartoacylase family protein, partial [Bacteroidota bacterium]
MSKVYSKALDEYLETDRIIGHLEGEEEGPCVVFFGGIHGNEPSGIFALKHVLDDLNNRKIVIKGQVYAIAGNLWALERSERFQVTDLNRLWTRDRLIAMQQDNYVPVNEDEKQQLAIQRVVLEVLSTRSGPFYFFDLHTTSGKTTPFMTVNDSLLNRKFAEQFPAPIILGIEEYLDGPLLSYLNELGYVSFGFEAGQHDDLASIENHVSFIYLALAFAGVIQKKNFDFDQHFRSLGSETSNFYEIYHRYGVKPHEHFRMEPGFVNFQRIERGQLLAITNGNAIHSPEETAIFMPLYQAKGEDGFFFIRKIPRVFLKVSALLRRWRFHKLLTILPGINRSPTESDTLLVNLKV